MTTNRYAMREYNMPSIHGNISGFSGLPRRAPGMHSTASLQMPGFGRSPIQLTTISNSIFSLLLRKIATVRLSSRSSAVADMYVYVSSLRDISYPCVVESNQ